MARRRSDQKKAKSHSGIISFVTGGAAQTQQSRQPLGDANGFAFVPHTVPWIPDTARWVVEPGPRHPARLGEAYCWVCPGSFGKPTPKRRPENQSFLQCETTKGPGRSHADRGLKLGDRKGAIFAPGRNLNAFYEAFMTSLCRIRLGRSTKKYLRTNIPWRPRIEPPQLKHLTSRSGIGWGGTSMRTISYFAPQLGQSNGTDCESDINAAPRIADHRLSKRSRPIDGQTRD